MVDPFINLDLNFIPMGFETVKYGNISGDWHYLNFVPMGFETPLYCSPLHLTGNYLNFVPMGFETHH